MKDFQENITFFPRNLIFRYDICREKERVTFNMIFMNVCMMVFAMMWHFFVYTGTPELLIVKPSKK